MNEKLKGILFLFAGVVLFLVGRQVPHGMPSGILAWALQLAGIYLGIFVGLKKIVKAEKT
ncbi:MAG: hypothetical protein HKO79_08960 [Desulfobacterales bacterium]|nr:hypothetical protein [Deltaproteobacteria bacterium]NNL42611.1 hypothetical protein [Desulfobacterales bacterium]